MPPAPTLTSRSSPTAPLDSEERRVKARHRRREVAAPYSLSMRGKGDKEESTVPVRRGGFFSRLGSYIPIVNKLFKEEEVEEDHVESYEDIQTTQEDVEEEEEEVVSCEENMETRQNDGNMCEAVEMEQTLEKETLLDVSASLRSRTHKEQPRGGSPKMSSFSLPSGAKINDRGSAMMPLKRKRAEKRVGIFGLSQQHKMLRIENTQGQQKSSSPSPIDTALAAVKKRKTISYEEFECLQHQLHEKVEKTPQAQLAMTQDALANDFECPFTRHFSGPTSFPGYVPGSIANQNHGAVVIQGEKKREREDEVTNGVPIGKRPRNRENGPIFISGTSLRGLLTHEKRLKRKLSPCRLLTGAQRDTSVHSTYSAAVAERILSTLRKLESPLEREAKRPTDTIPRVAFSQPSKKVAALSFGSPSTTAFDTPSKITNAVSNSVTSLVSPQAVSTTPAPIAKISTPEQLQFETTGEFKFTLPLCVEGMKQAYADDEDARVRFVFSPPPSIREPPVKVSKRKTAHKVDSSPAPFDVIPSSPKTKASEWVSKLLTAEERAIPKADAQEPVAAETADKSWSGSMAATPAGAANPLARFMQLKSGQWKCPGCSVLNEATSAKCPCCETAKPGGEATKKASSEASKVSDKNSSSNFRFDVAAVDAKKNTTKPAAGLITEGGFCFGDHFVDSKNITETPVASISSSGVDFGAPAADATEDAVKFTAIFASGGSSFTAPAVSSNKPRSATSTPPMAEMPSAAASMPSFTFGSSSIKPAGSSTFGQMLASTSSFGSTSTAFGSNSSNVYGSGSSAGGFGSTTSATKFGNAASSALAAPAFSFEASSHSFVPATTSAQPVFSFGASSGYGAAPTFSNGFVSSGPSGGFGTAPGDFSSSSPAPAFGNQSAPACSSNRPPFGGPEFGGTGYNGFSSGPPSSGFHTPSPTPAFGAAQAAPAFGAAPNMDFGATVPAAGAFGASTDGEFNMGTAPQHIKGRRILKAKSRNRRTS